MTATESQPQDARSQHAEIAEERFDPFYHNVKWTERLIGNRSFLIGETNSTEDGRTHRRVLGWKGSGVFGKPILYTDVYERGVRPLTYVYARRNAVAERFLAELDFLLATEGYGVDHRELRNRQFDIWMNLNGEMQRIEAALPLGERLGIFATQLKFVRVRIPFGDIAIDFADTHESNGEEAFRYRALRNIPKMLEAPLLAFDFSKQAEILPKLMERLHWAQGILPALVLEELITEVTEHVRA